MSCRPPTTAMWSRAYVPGRLHSPRLKSWRFFLARRSRHHHIRRRMTTRSNAPRLRIINCGCNSGSRVRPVQYSCSLHSLLHVFKNDRRRQKCESDTRLSAALQTVERRCGFHTDLQIHDRSHLVTRSLPSEPMLQAF